MEQFDNDEILRFLLEMAGFKGDKDRMVQYLMDEFGSLKNIFEAREEQLLKLNGIGRKTAAMIRITMPLVRVWERLNLEKQDRIGNSREAEIYCKSLLYGYRHEQFYAICLNARCYILGKRKISDGTLTEVNAYPRIILETALNYNAHSVLFCHNHPGGTNYPSPEDISSTSLLQRLLNDVGILVLDHIIIAGDNAYSMIQHGDINYSIRR